MRAALLKLRLRAPPVRGAFIVEVQQEGNARECRSENSADGDGTPVMAHFLARACEPARTTHPCSIASEHHEAYIFTSSYTGTQIALKRGPSFFPNFAMAAVSSTRGGLALRCSAHFRHPRVHRHSLARGKRKRNSTKQAWRFRKKSGKKREQPLSLCEAAVPAVCNA